MSDKVERMLEDIDRKVTETRDTVIKLETNQQHLAAQQQELKADVKDHGNRITRGETRSNFAIGFVSMIVSGAVSFLFFMFRGIFTGQS